MKMECTLNLKFDVDKCNKFTKVCGGGSHDQAQVYSDFVGHAVLQIVEELRKAGAHPEILEQAVRCIRFAPKVLQRTLYPKDTPPSFQEEGE